MPIKLTDAPLLFMIVHSQFATLKEFRALYTVRHTNKLTEMMHEIIVLFRAKNNAPEKYKNILHCPGHEMDLENTTYGMEIYQTSMRNLCLSTSPDRRGKISILKGYTVMPVIDYRIDSADPDAWKNIEYILASDITRGVYIYSKAIIVQGLTLHKDQKYSLK